MDSPQYRYARWGLYVADRASGDVVYDLNGGELFIPGSTTKLYPTAAALDAYGADYRFETPIYRRGPINAQGELQGDLILVASGDLTMGGRDTPDGHIDFTSIDHNDANALPLATLTPEDPLAGLHALARQVAAGIRRVRGNVIIDARLFPQMKKDDYVLSPIMINDNLIDLTITPGKVGQAATMAWRPQTASYHVQSEVRTVAAGQPLDVIIASPQPGHIVVQGQIPVDKTELVRTYQVEDPPTFARTLLIEALQRQGVTVDASPTGSNPAEQLPPQGSYTQEQRVAVHRSLPFAENIKLILKVSMNQQADTLICLLAVKRGKTTFDEGMQEILPFLQKAGLDADAVSLSDGRGNESTDLFSPRTVTQLLRYMSTRPDFRVYHDALPVLGVDGTEANTVPPSSPVRGKAAAKTGTVVLGDAMHNRPVLMTEGMAGYVTAKSGRELVFALYVNYVALHQVEDLFAVNKEQGRMVEAIFARQ
jgi:D-alanyl-D-alanine carboxypeptidase/D-alanyl-D-alanine-endopeptidase (penicillin-binding protein 4)